MRRIAPRRLLASTAVVAVASAGGLVVLAPSAQAAPVDYTTHCVNKYSPNLPNGQVQVDLQVTPDKPTYAVGDEITVKWHFTVFPKAPPTIPVIGKVPANSTYLDATVKLAGAQSGTFKLTGPQDNPEALPGQDLKVSDATGKFTVTTPGDVNLTPDIYSTWTTALGLKVPTDCSPVDPIAVSRTLKVEGTSQEPATLSAPAEANAGVPFALTGAHWPAGSPTVELCDAAGAACDAAKIAPGNTLAVADGALTGNVGTVATVPAGNYKIKVKVGAAEALAPIKINATARQISISPGSGPVGTTVKVTGKNFGPNLTIIARGQTATGYVLDETAAYADSAADGTVTIPDFVASDPSITAIYVTEGTDDTTAVTTPFRITVPGGNLDQTITGNVVAGGLTITQEAGAIKLSDITLNGQAQNMTGALNTVTVKDFRGGNTGWTLTGSVSDFGNGNGGKIGADKFTWTPKVTTGTGSPSTAVPGSAGPIGTGATLASAPAGASTGGTFSADADLSLAVPAYQAIGTYTSTLTLSIS
ncbi:hypothetical protein [Embleya sp. NPDC059237]|uniref:hypothetical protein n=1 Tax=Embleya sp. NPDC059237 TaxID=3346784 RepID=UPI0036C19878